ncbi:MAG: HAD family hydrolase [Acidimicrobiia bacterium]
MAQPVELVILDCDGVLVDSERLAIEIDVAVLADVGWNLTQEEVVERFVGRTDAYMLAEVERHTGKDISDDWYGKYAAVYREAFDARLAPVPGIEAALDRISLPTCVASSGTYERMEFTLGRTDLMSRFEGRITSADDVAHGKPAPDLFLLAADRMGFDPDVCVVVEDSRSGVEAARAAGMRSLGFSGGVTPAAWLEGPQTVVFDAMESLPDLIDSL